MDQVTNDFRQDDTQRGNTNKSSPEESRRERNRSAQSSGVQPQEKAEGEVTKQIEQVTSNVPSGAFLSFAFGAIAVSALLQLAGRKADAQFVGQWVPTVLVLGLYNKMVKLHGS